MGVTAPAAVTRPTRRFDGLEAQRGIAALLIVLFHVYQFDRSGPDAAYPYAGNPLEPLVVGFDGMVDWFFVLSAFLLTLPYAKAVLAGRPSTAPGRFLARRAVRIVPLYVVAVLVVWTARNGGLPGDWRDLLEHLTFTQVFDERRIFFTIGPAWSLAVEVQFYVLLGVLGTLATRWSTRRNGRGGLRLLVLGVGGLAVLSAAWCLVAALVLAVPQTNWPVWFSLPAKLFVFAAGMAAAVLVAARPLRLRFSTARLLSLLGVGIYAAACFSRQHTGGGDALFHALCGVAALAVVLASVCRPGPIGGAGLIGGQRRLVRALTWTGLVSYSLYLWHEPVLLYLAGRGLLPDPSRAAFPMTALVVVVVSLLVAWVSYVVLEHPASYLRAQLDGPRTPRPPLPTLPVLPAQHAPLPALPPTQSPQSSTALPQEARS